MNNPSESPKEQDQLCEKWLAWSRSRKLYGPAPAQTSLLGRLTIKETCHQPSIDAIASAKLMAFHFAYTCQPDTLEKRVFDFYYLQRVRPIKSAAAALGISTQHYYRLLARFRMRVYKAALALEAINLSIK